MDTKLLVFDLDGTLIDTMGNYADKAAELIFKNYGTPLSKAHQLYFETSGLPFKQQLEQLFPKSSDNADVALKFENWKDEYLLNVLLSSETEELLQYWRNAGFRIAIASNNLESYVKRLANNWPVDAALGYRSSDGFCKGEPHFQKLENDFGWSREQMLFIGDSPNDARIAVQSNIPFLALLSSEFVPEDFTKYYPDVKHIKQLSEINDYLNL
jgi:phosphoglycolate phosphatase-like HAD superfamily hydrolase